MLVEAGMEERFVYKKYSNKKCPSRHKVELTHSVLKASIFARNWAQKHATA